MFLDFHFSQVALTHLSAFSILMDWTFLSHRLRLMLSDELCPVRHHQELAPVQFLHLKITFHVKEEKIRVILEVTAFHRLCLPLLYTHSPDGERQCSPNHCHASEE